MKQRKVWALLLAATLLMSMTGCGSSGESGGEGTQTPAADSSAQTETPADASGEGRELICWTILNPESDADPRNVAFKKILDDWNANNAVSYTHLDVYKRQDLFGNGKPYADRTPGLYSRRVPGRQVSEEI